jgi:hypothetical protein
MSTIDVVLFIGFGLGLLVSFCGVVVANIAVQQMRGVLNSERTTEDQLRWNDAIQKVAQNVIDAYRVRYPEGPLSRKLNSVIT